MGLVAFIRGAMGLQGPPGANGVVGLLVLSWANNKFTVVKSSPAISVNVSTRVATFVVGGWYLIDWKTPAVFQAGNSTVTLSGAAHQVVGPLT